MKRMRWYDYITYNIYWLGLTTVSQTMTPLVLPLLVQQFVGEEGKGTFFGTLRLWTLMVALLVQALAGMLSDRSTLRWGRRRPFILLGTLVDLVFIAAIGFSASLEGMTGYWLSPTGQCRASSPTLCPKISAAASPASKRCWRSPSL